MLNHSDKLLKTTQIQDTIIESSVLLNHQVKQAFNQQSNFIRDFLVNNPKANLRQLNSLTSELLIYWNESINPDTEKFWAEMKQHQIDFVRKEPLKFALFKNRFRNVEQGIDAKNHWKDLRQLASILNNYSQAEIERIEKLIEEDEKKRYEVLEKCLLKKFIPQTQYLKFGECMAYFDRCQLFEVHFSKDQVDDLYRIWKSFKSY